MKVNESKLHFFNLGWWSVTPEIIAEYTAKLANGKSVIDGFCGSGGNVIQFSKYCKKVFAIDIDEQKLEICKNNCKVYKCENNISFILSDFLLADQYKPEKIFADYIFLSPPWGGIKYKKSDVYSIKELMTPNIYDIVKMSLKTAKKIMFYLPRTLILEELFDIIYEITKNDRIFFDIHILRSANKIKALLIIFGEDIDDKIKKEDLTKYFENEYQNYNLSENDIKIFHALRKLLGTFRLIKIENKVRNDLLDQEVASFEDGIKNLPKEVIKTIFNNILTEQEKIKIKSWNLIPKGNKGSSLKKEHTKEIETEKNNDVHIISTFTPLSACSTNDSFNLIKISSNLKRIKEISFEILV